MILVGFGYVLGGANALRVNFDAIDKRSPGWPYKIVLIVSLVATVVVGVIEGPGFLQDGMRSKWIYDWIYSPMSSTMFALLAFFIASAAFRAFRISTVDAGLLAAAAIVMLGRVPLGNLLTDWLFRSRGSRARRTHFREHRAEWIMDNPRTRQARDPDRRGAGRHGHRLARDPGHRAQLPERGGLSA